MRSHVLSLALLALLALACAPLRVPRFFAQASPCGAPVGTVAVAGKSGARTGAAGLARDDDDGAAREVRPAVVASKPECHMGADGRQACGYHCKMGADGVEACANTPDGACAMGADGHVVCSQVAASNGGGPPPHNANGTWTCS